MRWKSEEEVKNKLQYGNWGVYTPLWHGGNENKLELNSEMYNFEVKTNSSMPFPFKGWVWAVKMHEKS